MDGGRSAVVKIFVCKDIGDDKYLVEHLEQHPLSHNDFWQHSKVKVVQAVFKKQI